LIRDVGKDLTLEEIRAKFVRDVDLLISEGYKREVQPKIEVFRKEKHQELLCAKDDQLIAIVSNQGFDMGVPVFDLDDMKGLADFIEKEYLQPKEKRDISLFVDGKAIPLNPFVRGFLSKSILGMVRSLRGCAAAKNIEIRIESKELEPL
jgi:molybdopterin-guanine dinucleotide biosynthesis protein B